MTSEERVIFKLLIKLVLMTSIVVALSPICSKETNKLIAELNLEIQQKMKTF